MKIKMNLKNNFKLVEEGKRVLKITKAEAKPSGKPTSLVVTFQDIDGGIITSRYSFENSGAVWAMSKLCEIALGLKDGDEFDTSTDTQKLIGKELICEVSHSKGTKANDKGEFPTFANVKKVISLVNENTGEVSESPRNSIIDDDLD